MRVFKFGGASVSSAEAVRGMAQIVKSHLGVEPLVVVVSAMGKTTNLLEKLVPSALSASHELRQQLEDYHLGIARELLPSDEALIDKVLALLHDCDILCNRLPKNAERYNYSYDQVVSYGEILSTTIIAHYLNHIGIRTAWVDARQLISTDSHFREGRVQWDATRQAVALQIGTRHDCDVILTQGFIGGTAEGHTTTLGREGSDYSAAILAHCLRAESVTIWKDVPGFLNADPKYFKDTVKIHQIPYNEAIELAYYGASVIHPKTVKPLQNLGIPLFIRSFVNPDEEGSVIGQFSTLQPETPLYIFRRNQLLLSIAPRDYSFIAEDHLQSIFGILNEVGVRVNLMQNSALSFSLCVDDHPTLSARLIDRLNTLFQVRYNQHLQLITVRYYTSQVIDRIVDSRPILLEQRSRTTAQIIVSDESTQEAPRV